MADNHNAAADSAPGVNSVQQPYLLGNPTINMQGDMHSNKRLKTGEAEYLNLNYLHTGTDLNSAICPTVIDNNNLANSQPNSIGQLNSTGVVINSQPTVVSHQANANQQPKPGQGPPQQQHILNPSMLQKPGNPQQSVP